MKIFCGLETPGRNYSYVADVQSQSQSQLGICIAPLTELDSGAEHVQC